MESKMNAKKYNTKYTNLVNQILKNKYIMSYVDTKLYDTLNSIIYNK